MQRGQSASQHGRGAVSPLHSSASASDTVPHSSGLADPVITTITITARYAKRMLKPAAPAFTPFAPQLQPHRLDSTPPSPAESMDSAGPATPSPLPPSGVHAGSTGMGKGGVRIPWRWQDACVVRPEEVVVGDWRACEVFVF